MLVWIYLGLLSGFGQSGAANPTANELLSKAMAYAKRYQAVLPSLLCDEEILSGEVKNGLVKRQTTIRGTMRLVRSDDRKVPFAETHQFTEFDGHPVVEGQKHYFPYFLQGGFANGLAFLSSDRAKCYTASIAPMEDESKVRVSLSPRPGMDGVQECEGTQNVTSRFVVIERASGNVLHSERTVRPEFARKAKESYFVSIDYSPVELGGEAVWVPVKVIAYDPKQEGRFEASYTNFHRFSATVTIVPGSEKPSQQ